jgi:hypothetical protein
MKNVAVLRERAGERVLFILHSPAKMRPLPDPLSEYRESENSHE